MTKPARTHARFPSGRIMLTRGVMNLLAELGQADPIATVLCRHAGADWGDLDLEDIEANDRALRQGGRLVSNYVLPSGHRVWIITEADRSVTTVLLPEEY